jgi:hypothetical protein
MAGGRCDRLRHHVDDGALRRLAAARRGRGTGRHRRPARVLGRRRIDRAPWPCDRRHRCGTPAGGPVVLPRHRRAVVRDVAPGAPRRGAAGRFRLRRRGDIARLRAHAGRRGRAARPRDDRPDRDPARDDGRTGGVRPVLRRHLWPRAVPGSALRRGTADRRRARPAAADARRAADAVADTGSACLRRLHGPQDRPPARGPAAAACRGCNRLRLGVRGAELARRRRGGVPGRVGGQQPAAVRLAEYGRPAVAAAHAALAHLAALAAGGVGAVRLAPWRRPPARGAGRVAAGHAGARPADHPLGKRGGPRAHRAAARAAGRLRRGRDAPRRGNGDRLVRDHGVLPVHRGAVGLLHRDARRRAAEDAFVRRAADRGIRAAAGLGPRERRGDRVGLLAGPGHLARAPAFRRPVARPGALRHRPGHVVGRILFVVSRRGRSPPLVRDTGPLGGGADRGVRHCRRLRGRAPSASFASRRFRLPRRDPADCAFALHRDVAGSLLDDGLPSGRWNEIWHGHRPGLPDEVIRLYRRSSG